MSAAQPPPPAPAEAVGEAKRLLRVARTAALATLDGAAGAPLTTLVSVASDYDGAPLLLLSALARHTRNLAVDPRGSLLLTSPPGRGDPLNRPRLTISGLIVTDLEPSARARFLARNPKSKLYAPFADFSLFRMEISAVHFNGGFARAAALTPADILADLAGAEALIAMEAALLEEINAREAAFRARLAGAKAADKSRAWRAVGIDPEGLDLAAGARAARASFLTPALSPAPWRKALANCSGRRRG
jgi:putative heme iron utilization protein